MIPHRSTQTAPIFIRILKSHHDLHHEAVLRRSRRDSRTTLSAIQEPVHPDILYLVIGCAVE